MSATLGQNVAFARRIGMQGAMRPGMRLAPALARVCRSRIARRFLSLRGRRARIVRRLRWKAKLGLKLGNPHRQPLDLPGQRRDRLRLRKNQPDQRFLVERLKRVAMHPSFESALVPIYLGLCREADLNKGHEAAGALINANLSMAALVSVVHSLAMIAAGGFLAWLVYRYLGLKFVSRSWFNLDATWAFSLVLVGALSLAISMASRH
jgi:hypothetical protein